MFVIVAVSAEGGVEILRDRADVASGGGVDFILPLGDRHSGHFFQNRQRVDGSKASLVLRSEPLTQVVPFAISAAGANDQKLGGVLVSDLATKRNQPALIAR